MCGRFLLDPLKNEKMIRLVSRAKQALGQDNVPSGDIYPGDFAILLIAEGSKLKIGTAQWGFLLGQTKKIVINARSESLLEKAMFRDCFATNRCLIPTSGFYEWKDASEGKKRKYLCALRDDREILYLAGCYDAQKKHFVVITKDADAGMRQIHDRMPLIISSEHCEAWLNDVEKAHRFLKGQEETELVLSLLD